jgi:hypothetical protein
VVVVVVVEAISAAAPSEVEPLLLMSFWRAIPHASASLAGKPREGPICRTNTHKIREKVFMLKVPYAHLSNFCEVKNYMDTA